MGSDYHIAELHDGLEVRGVSRPELTEALDLLNLVRSLRDQYDASRRGLSETVLPELLGMKRVEDVGNRGELAETLELLKLVRTLQAEHVDASREELLRALMSRNVSLTPIATLSQARRLATHRDALLATPWHTYESLGELRGEDLASNTRVWVARRKKAHGLFTVRHRGRALIPGFQFDQHGELRPELQPVLSALNKGGVEDWSLWTWLTNPTSFLSGEIPEQVALTDPARALHAARRFAAVAVA